MLTGIQWMEPEVRLHKNKLIFRAVAEQLLTDMSHRVEHQKLNQVAVELPPA